jgi:hypothetical protein
MSDYSEMNQHDLSVSYQPDGGQQTWNFHCPQCAFYGEYVLDGEDGLHQLDIFDPGDAEAFHFDASLFARLFSNSLELSAHSVEVIDWRSLFTPETLAALSKFT